MTSTSEREPGLSPAPGPALVSIGALRTAAEALEGVAVRTPLLDIPALAAQLGVPVAAKCEQLQPVGAFKIRGAYTAISRIPPAERARGVITYSSGNHGQAVAMAARLLGTHAVIVMPERAPAIKVAGVKRLGGEVVFAGNSSAERYEAARALASERGLAMVPPYESLDVIAGQGTCGLEILESRPEVETILVPVGGGGLIAGISAAVAALKPSVRVVGVEPEGAPKLARALEAGRPVKLGLAQSLADGLLPLSVGELPFAVLSGVVREAVQVSETEITAAVRFLYQTMDLVVEPSGAVTTAALLTGRVRPTGSTVVLVSGGNVDPELFSRLVTSHEARSVSPGQAPGTIR
ncbi:MAG: Threonine dehydratase, catabolic [Geminicoccaceae bacterium]|nr:Threonine dehydratase, catabolic [Geminicoccaceae bacterium]